MSRIQQGIMMAFLEDIWSYNFINFFASPLEIREYLAGLVMTSVSTSFIGLLTMVLIAGLFFGYNVFRIGLLILPFMLVLFVFGMAMGFFISAVIFRLGPSGEWLGWPIPLVLSIFTGVFYPIATLPVSFQYIAHLIPASYVFESLRAILSGNTAVNIGSNLIIGSILALIYLALTYLFFIRVYRQNLKNGNIARFGAEAS